MSYNSDSNTYNWQRNGREVEAGEWSTHFPDADKLAIGDTCGYIVNGMYGVRNGRCPYPLRFVCELWE